jgi:hypothetical protein
MQTAERWTLRRETSTANLQRPAGPEYSSGWSGPAQSQALKAPYPELAPAEQYRIANREYEIALARSAAPQSISGDAQVNDLLRGNGGSVEAPAKLEAKVETKDAVRANVLRASWDESFLAAIP